MKPYFADVEQVTGDRREDLEQQLLDNKVKALAASVALGMGFDKPDLSFVIHYQRPGSIIAYYQQIGRAGRGIDTAHIVLMPGLEDEDVHRYFIDTAFPTPEQVESVVAALEQNGALSRRDIQKRVNVRGSALEKILLHLEVDEVIAWKDSEYAAMNPDKRPDYARWQRVTAQRYAELAQMNAYLGTPGCLMQYLAAALDDHTATEPCGRCANCSGTSSLKQPTREQIDAASRFLRDGKPLHFEPRKQWPNRFSETLRGRFKPANEMGITLCQYHDQGYGDLVKRGKYQDGRFDDELVNAAAELLRAHWQTLAAPPVWVAAVPSRAASHARSRFRRAVGRGAGTALSRCREQDCGSPGTEDDAESVSAGQQSAGRLRNLRRGERRAGTARGRHDRLRLDVRHCGRAAAPAWQRAGSSLCAGKSGLHQRLR